MRKPLKPTLKKLSVFMLVFLVIINFSGVMPPIHPVKSYEFENIDSFDVHPKNRWDETNTNFDNITTGDGF